MLVRCEGRKWGNGSFMGEYLWKMGLCVHRGMWGDCDEGWRTAL